MVTAPWYAYSNVVSASWMKLRLSRIMFRSGPKTSRGAAGGTGGQEGNAQVPAGASTAATAAATATGTGTGPGAAGRRRPSPLLAGSTSGAPAALAQSISEDIPSLEELCSRGRLTQKYDVEDKVLGVGQFAVVKPCRDIRTGKPCAVKLIKRSSTSEERLATEIAILERLRGHPNIVGLYDVFITSSEVQLVMEFVSGGELFGQLVRAGPYSEAEAAHHMRRVVAAVDFLHRQGVVHRDLKPENLLLTSLDPRLSEVKVADFGLARIYTESAMETMCGTWAYAAPEVRNTGGYGPGVDVWSLGVIMYVLLVAYHPFDPRGVVSDDEMRANVESGRFDFADAAWKNVSADAKHLIRCMVAVDPDDRYTAEQVLAHPWITGSHHGKQPLSPRINLDLDNVRSRYKQKIGAASKAVWAHTAFTGLLKETTTAKKAKLSKSEECIMDVDDVFVAEAKTGADDIFVAADEAKVAAT